MLFDVHGSDKNNKITIAIFIFWHFSKNITFGKLKNVARLRLPPSLKHVVCYILSFGASNTIAQSRKDIAENSM